MDIRSMMAEIQIYIHIMTGRNEILISLNVHNKQEMFAFKSAWHTATRYLFANNIKPILLSGV